MKKLVRAQELERNAGFGSTVASSPRDPAEAIVDPLTLIPPARRQLVQARIDVIAAYLALTPPTAAAAVKSAEKLGVALSTFYALARIWKERRDPSDLVSSGNMKVRHKTRILGDEAFIEEALRTMPVGPTIENDVVELIKMASDKGVTLRSVSALRRKVRALRPSDRDDPEGDLVLGQVALSLPITHQDGAILPIATIIAHRQSRALLAVRLSEEPNGSRQVAKTLIEALLAKRLVDGDFQEPGSVRSLSIGAARDDETQSLHAALGVIGFELSDSVPRVRPKSNAYCARLLSSIDLKAFPNMGAWSADRRSVKQTTRLNVPVTIDEAQEIIVTRLALKQAPPTSLGEGIDAIAVALALQPFAA